MRGQALVGIGLVLAAAAPAAGQAATEIAGSVTARREGAVQVRFEPRAGVGPAVGDAVTFSTEIDGIRVDAGRGEVAEVGAASVWVRVSRGRPGVGHRAAIRATGRAAAGADPAEGRQPPTPPLPPAGPPTSHEAAAGPAFIDLPAQLDRLPFTANWRPPGPVDRGGRRLLRPAGGWPRYSAEVTRSDWGVELGPLDEAAHFRVSLGAAVYGADTQTMAVGILWYPPGSGRGVCTPQVNRNPRTGRIGLIGLRGDVRVVFSPSAFMFALKEEPDLSALRAFAQDIFAQLEPFANPCRP